MNIFGEVPLLNVHKKMQITSCTEKHPEMALEPFKPVCWEIVKTYHNYWNNNCYNTT